MIKRLTPTLLSIVAGLGIFIFSVVFIINIGPDRSNGIAAIPEGLEELFAISGELKEGISFSSEKLDSRDFIEKWKDEKFPTYLATDCRVRTFSCTYEIIGDLGKLNLISTSGTIPIVVPPGHEIYNFTHSITENEIYSPLENHATSISLVLERRPLEDRLAMVSTLSLMPGMMAFLVIYFLIIGLSSWKRVRAP